MKQWVQIYPLNDQIVAFAGPVTEEAGFSVGSSIPKAIEAGGADHAVAIGERGGYCRDNGDPSICGHDASCAGAGLGVGSVGHPTASVVKEQAGETTGVGCDLGGRVPGPGGGGLRPRRALVWGPAAGGIVF